MELIDREKLKATIREMVELPAEMRVQALAAVSRAKAVDAVEVCRCKDCAYWNKATVNKGGFLICPASGMEIMADDFCSYGERRGQE